MNSRPGHGDHWRAVLGEDPGALAAVLEFPADPPDGLKLHRTALTPAADLVQVTARRRLITAYPEPRATTLIRVRPRELLMWETRVEGWLVVEHAGAGALTLFLTDLVESATEYQRARGEIELEVGGLAYTLERAPAHAGPNRLRPARELDDRFLPDDHWFAADVRSMRNAGEVEVVELELQGGLHLPVASHRPRLLRPGDRAQGFAWLTARWPQGQEEQGS